jgi:hypothetical protein
MPLGLSASILGSGGASSGGVGTVIHNNTTGKQGGSAGEYYHLNLAEVTKVRDSNSDVENALKFDSKQGLIFAGTAGAGIANIPAFGTGPCSFTYRITVPTTNPVADVFIMSQYGTGLAPYDDIFVWVGTSGQLRINFRYSSTDHLVEFAGFVSTYGGQTILLSITADGANAYAYVNGAQIATAAIAHNLTGTTFKLGQSDTGGFYYGTISSIAIHSRALSAGEVATIAETGLITSISTTGLICYPDPAVSGYGLKWEDSTSNNADVSWTSGVSWIVPSSGSVRASALFLPNFTPASATAAGEDGAIACDANYFYHCSPANTWKRAALSTW